MVALQLVKVSQYVQLVTVNTAHLLVATHTQLNGHLLVMAITRKFVLTTLTTF